MALSMEIIEASSMVRPIDIIHSLTHHQCRIIIAGRSITFSISLHSELPDIENSSIVIVKINY